MKLSVSLILTDILTEKRNLYHTVVRNKLFHGSSPSCALRSLQQAGIEGVEIILPSFCPLSFSDIQELKKLLWAERLSVLSVHQVLRFFTNTNIGEITHLFEIASEMNAHIVVLHTSSAGKQLFAKEYLSMLYSLQKQYQIIAGFENMEKLPVRLRKQYVWEEKKFAEMITQHELHMTLDTTHLAHSGGDIIRFVRQHQERIINIHLSDYRMHFLNSSLRPIRYKHLPLGQGNLPIQEFLHLLQKQNYTGLVTMEMNASLPEICQSAQAVKRIMHDFPV